jgi:TalC/MipB family fructose-6-phosphate aldolase
MAKEGISGKNNVLKHYKAICEIVDGDVSAEVIATDFEGMIREGEELAELDDKIVVKIPMIKDGVKALRYFSEKGIKTNCTLIFSAGQALLAAKAGASMYLHLSVVWMTSLSMVSNLSNKSVLSMTTTVSILKSLRHRFVTLFISSNVLKSVLM